MCLFAGAASVLAVTGAPAGATKDVVALFSAGKWSGGAVALRSHAPAGTDVQAFVAKRLIDYAFDYYNRRDIARAQATASIALAETAKLANDKTTSAEMQQVFADASLMADVVLGDLDAAMAMLDAARDSKSTPSSPAAASGAQSALDRRRVGLADRLKVQKAQGKGK